MTTTREQVAAPAKIGSFEFEATVVSGGGRRNLAPQGGIGRDGEDHDDLGEAGRREQLEADLDEIGYQKLENLRRAAKPYTIVHPLLGAFWGRIHGINYQGNPEPDLLKVTIELVEEGDHTTQMPAVVLSLSAAAQAARSAYDDLGWDDLDGLADIGTADLDGVLDNTGTAFKGAWGDFDDLMSAAELGTATWEEVSDGFVALGEGVQGLLDELPQAYEQCEKWITTSWEHGLHALMGAAGDVVTAARGAGAAFMRQVKVKSPQSIWELSKEWLGADDDETVNEILEANPQLIDLVAILPGTELQIPVK